MNTTLSNKEMGIYRSLFFAGLLFWIFQSSLLAQSKDSTAIAEISGTWVMDADVQMQKSSSLKHNGKNPLKEEHRESQLEGMKSRVYVFHADGQFESSWVSKGGSQVVYGTWQISKDGLLEIVLENSSSFAYTILLGNKSLELNPGSGDSQSINLKRIEL